VSPQNIGLFAASLRPLCWSTVSSRVCTVAAIPTPKPASLFR